MGTVFLAGVCEYRDVLCSDLPSVSEQGTGIRGLEKSFVRDAGKCESLGTYELAVSRQGGRECGLIGPGQDLNAKRPFGEPSEGGGDEGHRCGDLRSDLPFEIGEIVHVLDDQGIESGLEENLRILGDTIDDLIKTRCRPGCPGQCWNMDHSDQGTVSAEQLSGSCFRDVSVWSVGHGCLLRWVFLARRLRRVYGAFMSDIHLNTPGGASVLIAPDCGFCCLSWKVEGEERLHLPEGADAFRDDVKTGGLPLLYPYANRLREDPGPDWANNPLVKRDGNDLPIHGFLLRFSHWTEVITDGTTARAALDWAAHDDLMALYPYPHRLEVAYELFETRLRVTTTVIADGGVPVPISFGWHPYFALLGEAPAKSRLTVPHLEHVLLDDQCLPVRGNDRSLSVLGTEDLDGEFAGRAFDDLFLRPDENVSSFVVTGPDDSLSLSFGAPWTCVQIYHPEGSDFVAIEPMTAPGAALSDDLDHPMLEAGGTFSAVFEVCLS